MTPQDLMMLSMQQRIEYIAPLIQKYESPISVPVRIAQAIQESTIFTSELGRDANNGFGIKASAPWTGVTHPHVSGEHVNGKNVKEKSLFRKYPNIEASVKDHAAFFTSTEFRKSDTAYGLAIKATTYEEEAKNLGPKFPGDKASYAGDPNYASSLMKHIKNYNLAKYDTKNIEKENAPMAKLTREQAFAKLGLTFKKQPLPLTKTFGRINKKRGTVIHQTGSPGKGLDAQWMADYQKRMSSASNREEKSWNYQVDDKEAIMSFDHDVATWQASDGNGPGNTAHISIEACINSDGDYNKTIDNLAKTMAVIAYVENFKDIESTTGRHYDFARDKKWCPAQIMNGKNGFTYAKVKAMAQAHLNTLNGAKATSDANPQGLDTSKIPAYQEPKLAFDRLEKGAQVTFRNPWNWYDDSKKEFIHSKKHDELLGTKFTIDEIKDITPIGYSKVAYKSKEHNSWILEQDIIEARKSWEVVKVDAGLKDEGKVTKELEEGQFWIVDTLYQVSEIK